MTEHKYTDEEVIKALECCASHLYACEDCHYLGKCRLLEKDAIDLINRQKAEIADLQDGIKCEEETNKHLSGEHITLMKECYGLKAEIVRLEAETKRLKDMFEDNETQRSYTINMLGEHLDKAKGEIAFWMDAAANAKKEAVKEFAEKVKEYAEWYTDDNCSFDYIPLEDIDNAVKEFTEEKT
jgi:predicted RNase H-like nuclease (RuvC/YqgF family)